MGLKLALGLVAIGAATVALGLGLIYPPAGVIAAGAAAAALGLFGVDVDTKRRRL